MRLCLTFPLLLALLLSGCNDGDNRKSPPAPAPLPVSAAEVLAPAGGTAQPDGGAPVSLTVSGKISFERLLPSPTGLSATPAIENAAFVRVEIVRHDDSSVLLAPAVSTDANGDYTVSFTTDRDFYVRARAQLSAASLVCRVLHTQMATPVVHAASSTICSRAISSQTVNVLASAALPHARAGAFCALDTARKLAQSVEFSGSPSLGALDLFWAPGNLDTAFMRDLAMQPVSLTATGYTAVGPLGQPGIIVSGGRWDAVATTDHDEFDEAVIAHEFVHFIMRSHSRENNWGGDHNGEALVPGAAYSEGVPTGLGCILLGNKAYIDTVGLPPGSSVRFSFDCENPSFVAGVPSAVTGVSGYQSEFAVAAVVWDLLDGAGGNPASSDGDPVGIDRADFFASFYALSTRMGSFDVAWLASLLQQLVDDSHVSAADAHTLVSPYNASFPPTLAQLWPPAINSPASESGSLNAAVGPGGTPGNRAIGLGANATWRLELASAQSLTLNLSATAGTYAAAAHQLDLYVYDLGNNLVASQTGAAQIKSMNLSLAAGVYLVRVHHAAATPASSSYTLAIP